jgi:hypothetical protein
MSRWTTVPLSLILLSLSAGVAAAADDLPRNIELKPGAVALDGQTAADTSTSEDKTRQIVTEPAAAAPTDAAGKPDTPKEGEGASTAAPPVTPPPAGKAAAPEGAKPAETTAVAAPPPGPSPVELKPEELALAVQTELKRVGCDPGEVDGVWGGRSREALAAFGHFAKVGVAELAPTPEILALIKGKSAVVCVASGEVQAPVGEAAPPPEPAPSHHDGGGGYYGGGRY